MKKTVMKTLFFVLVMVSLLLVGCGGKQTVTDNNNRTETNVVESEVSSQEETPTLEPTETPTPIPTETPTPVPTEVPTPIPTEIPTSTPEPTPHEHSYTVTIITEALCNTTGVKQYSCSCGDSYNKEYIDSHNHQGDGNPRVLKESDCETRGIYGEICIRCGLYVNSKTLDPTGHTPDSYWIYHHGTGTYRLGCANCGVLLDETTEKPEGVEIRDFYPRPIN